MLFLEKYEEKDMLIYEKPFVEIIEVEMGDIVCESVKEDEDGGGRIF